MTDKNIVLKGIVQKGDGIQWKQPTANVAPDCGRSLPPGFYGCHAVVRGEILGAALINSQAYTETLEVYISQFQGDLYGEVLELHGILRLERDILSNLYDLALLSLRLTLPETCTSFIEPSVT
jgi:FAD synthase